MVNPVFNNFTEFKQIFLDFDGLHRNSQSPLDIVLDQLSHRAPQLCLEFGVWTGNSIRKIHHKLPKWKIYGFDSFEGLPEQWESCKSGTFSLNGNEPSVHEDIILIKGWFNETLPLWVQNNPESSPIKLLHVDCDLYSSTTTIFNIIGHLITNQTVIVFDEFLHYHGYENHEMLAFYEFLLKYQYEFHIIACGGENTEKLALVCSASDIMY